MRLLEIMIAYYILAHIISGIILSLGLADKNFADYIPLYKDQLDLSGDSSIISVMDRKTLYIQALYLAANALTHGTIGDLKDIYFGSKAWSFILIWCITFCYMLLFACISSIFRGGEAFLEFFQRYKSVTNSIPYDKLD